MKIVINGEAVEIPSGSGGGESAGEVYSTEETRIGTWVDGKPLYRIAGSFHIETMAIKNYINFDNIDVSSIDQLIGQKGPCVVNDGSKLFIGSDICGFMMESGYLYFRQIYSNSGVYGYDGYAVFEYTKTTD